MGYMPGANRSVKDDIREYWDGRAPAFDSVYGHGVRTAREEAAWRATVRRLVDPSPGMTVVDLACGTGIIGAILASFGCVVTGVDFSEAMLERARSKVVPGGRSMRLVLADVDRTWLPSVSFDVAICRYLLWTLPDPEASLAEWRRLLKPGGRLVVIDGEWCARDDPLYRLRVAIGRRIWPELSGYVVDRYAHILPHLRFRDGGAPASEAAALLRAAGFEKIEEDPLRDLRRLDLFGAPLSHRFLTRIARRYALRAFLPTG